MLLCGSRDFEVPRVMPPDAKRERAEKQQERADAEQPAAESAAAIVLAGRPQLTLPVPRLMLQHAGIEIGHLQLLRKDALRRFAVVALAQHGEEVGHDQQGGWCR